jgi:hypothetical protein
MTSVRQTLAKAANGAKALASGAIDAINLANDQNIVNRGVSAIGGAISGDQSWTLGGWIYDIMHTDPMEQPPQNNAPIDFGGQGDW